MRKTTNADELLGIAYKFSRRNVTVERRNAFMQGAIYIIKHLPEEWKQTISKT